jgi:hypothetical protein
MKFDMGFKDINNWVATNGMITGDKIIKDIMMMHNRLSFLFEVKRYL